MVYIGTVEYRLWSAANIASSYNILFVLFVFLQHIWQNPWCLEYNTILGICIAFELKQIQTWSCGITWIQYYNNNSMKKYHESNKFKTEEVLLEQNLKLKLLVTILDYLGIKNTTKHTSACFFIWLLLHVLQILSFIEIFLQICLVTRVHEHKIMEVPRDLDSYG